MIHLPGFTAEEIQGMYATLDDWTASQVHSKESLINALVLKFGLEPDEAGNLIQSWEHENR